jgi:hypothetical protein
LNVQKQLFVFSVFHCPRLSHHIRIFWIRIRQEIQNLCNCLNSAEIDSKRFIFLFSYFCINSTRTWWFYDWVLRSAWCLCLLKIYPRNYFSLSKWLLEMCEYSSFEFFEVPQGDFSHRFDFYVSILYQIIWKSNAKSTLC